MPRLVPRLAELAPVLLTAVLTVTGGCAAGSRASAGAERAAPAPSAASATAPAPTPSEQLAAALAALDRSRYARAEARFRALLEGPEAAGASLGLGRLLLLTGRYAELVQLLERPAAGDRAGLEAVELMARALRAQGRLEPATALLEARVDEPAARRLRLLLAEIRLEQGERAAAEPLLMTLIEDNNADRIRDDDGQGMKLVGRAAHLLRSARDANDAYNLAERALDHDVELLLQRAELFLEKHDPGHAEEVAREILERAPAHPDALVTLAQVKLAQTYDFDSAERLAREALGVNPRHLGARFVLAGIALRDMELGRAERELDAGLRVNPRELRLLSLQAAVRFLADDPKGFAAAERAVLDLNREYSTLYQIVGEYAEWEHRYDEIVELMRRAILIDARDAKARADLGIHLLRAGRDADGVRALAMAFADDPFNVRVYNTLNLYERTIPRDYVTVERGPFRFRFHRDQSALLERYVPPLLERAWSEMVDRYAFTPAVPVPIELYPEREHFAVRTSGLPNIGIQGVCFGRSVAAMSPGQETFNLGMTLWHELSHVFHIQRSKNHVPRWFTEGLAEWETLTAEPGWRRELDRQLHEAVRDGRLPAVADMNRAFTRAEDMDDMATAYYGSTRILVMLEREFGMGRVREMLTLWGEGKRTPEVIERVLGLEPAAVDAAFRRSLERELARYRGQFVPLRRGGELEQAAAVAAAAASDAKAHCRHALAALEAGDESMAAAALARARAIAPNDPDAIWLEARLGFAREDLAAAERAVTRLITLGQNGYEVELALAKLRERRGDLAGMKAALERAHEFDPLEAEPLAALVDLGRETRDREAELAALRKLALLEEHDVRVHQRLLRLLIDAERWDEAVRAGTAALYVDLTGHLTHQLYAEALAGAGRHRDALFELESALLCDARPAAAADIHAQVAATHLARGDRASARRAAAKARELDPENARLRSLAL